MRSTRWASRFLYLVALGMAPSAQAGGRLVFDDFPQLRGTVVSTVFEDRGGQIWIGTSLGAWRGHYQRFDVVPTGTAERLAVRCFAESTPSTVWVGTDRGLYRVIGDAREATAMPWLADRKVLTLFRMNDRRIVAGTDRGVFAFDPSAADRRPDVLLPDFVDAFGIAAGHGDDLWIVGHDGLLHWTAKETTRHLPGFNHGGPYCLQRDALGTLWLGCRKPGALYRCDGSTWSRVTPAEGLLNDDVNAIACTPNGEVWLGTEDGVFLWDGVAFTHIGKNEGMPNVDVHALLVDREEHAWIGTFGSGIALLRSPRIVNYGLQDGLPHPMVTALTLDATGTVVVGTLNHAVRFDRSAHFGVPQGPRLVSDLHVDGNGALWIVGQSELTRDDREWPLPHGLGRCVTTWQDALLVGTTSGLYRFDEGTFERLPLPRAGSAVLTARPDADGALYVGLSHGLVRGDPGGAWSEVWSGGAVNRVFRDRRGRLWFGHNDGAVALVTAGPEDGAELAFPGLGIIRDIVEDDAGTLWLASDSGLHRYRDDQMVTFTEADGFFSAAIQTLQPDGPGRLLLGTSQGLAVVQTLQLRPCTAPPAITLRHWRIGTRVGGHGVQGGTTPARPDTAVFELQALGGRSTAGVAFQHRLEPSTPDWTPSSPSGLVVFSGLAPGAYTFFGRAISPAGHASSAPVQVPFYIPYPMWRQPLVMALAAVAALAMGLMVRAQRGRRRQRQQASAALQRQQNRARKMETAGTMAAGLAHDVNNMLTAILGYNERLRAASLNSPIASEAVAGIDQVAHQATALTRALLTFGRERTTHLEPLELAPLIGECLVLAHALVPETIHIQGPVENGRAVWIRGDAILLRQALVNLILNARDAMPNGGSLSFAIRTPAPEAAPQRIALIVEDTGAGMTAAVRERIFDPFFTTKTRGQGTGLGLAVVHGVIRDHGGEIAIDSTPGKGTRITISLPLGTPLQPVTAPAALPTPTPVSGRILLAEDDPAVSTLFYNALVRAGHVVDTASDGADFLALFARHREETALVVLDQDLPHRSGTSCLTAIRCDRPDLPAILITGHRGLELDAETAPHTHLLYKPFPPSQLCALIDQVLATQHTRATDPAL